MKERRDALVGAIEAGGTKLVCAVGSGPGDRILSRQSFPTGDDPVRVLAAIMGWFRQQQHRHGPLQALGVASFGPLDLDPASRTYGYITSTPKTGWRNTDLLGPIRAELGDLPIGFDTDVNGAALGEYHWGSAAGLTDFVYITIGTGIGAGGMSGGRLLHGLLHPEMGHMLLPRGGDDFEGVCPFHGACWEGLCSGPAIRKRTGISPADLPGDHPAWTIEARYVACAVSNITCILSPERVILGGSVRKAGRLGQDGFFRLIRQGVKHTLNGYISSPALNEEIDAYIVPPLLGDDAGICGAIALAQTASL
ncbi:MAG: ROK family protein [Polyangiaceae bacterium]|nr:ROK family protein [Polyangiaceae bacterium]